MDSPYARHSGVHRIADPWPIRVPLQPDELISSWLTRTALAHGCDPLVLTSSVWPKWPVWTVDVDRGMSGERLQQLTILSRIPVEEFEAASLRKTAQPVTEEDLDGLAVWPWVLALGSRNRKRRGGLQYCPACLKSDSQPYYRMKWRLAWHTTCARHQIPLLDLCPHCQEAITPHRLNAQDGNMTTCASCRQDLCTNTSTPKATEALALQDEADLVVKRGWGTYGDDVLPSQEWFAVLRFFLTLLRQASLQQPVAVSKMLEILEIDVRKLLPPATGLPLELLPTHEREHLLSVTWILRSAGPDQFQHAARRAAVTGASLKDQRQSAPAKLNEIIQELPDRHATGVRRAQVDRATRGVTPKPKSRRVVMRMHARLKRKQ